MIEHILKDFRLKDSFLIFTTTIFTVASLFFLYPEQIDVIKAIKIFAIMLMYSIYSFSSNNHFDRDNDKKNQTKIKVNPVASGDLSIKQSFILNIVLISSILLMTMLWFFNSLPFMILSIIIVSVYSYKMKNFPILDIIVHEVWITMFFVFPLIQFYISQTFFILLLLILLFSSNMMQFHNQLGDYMPDKLAKVNTTVVRLGIKKSVILYYSSVISFVVSVLFISYYISIFSLVFLIYAVISFLEVRKIVVQTYDKNSNIVNRMG
jgi:4-hydroxybenzoate polyprenyltransferase